MNGARTQVEPLQTLRSGERLLLNPLARSSPRYHGGAALIRPIDGGKRCELTYLDRENQGGLIPAWGMNLSMPKFLFDQAEQVQRFFVGGGPPELSRPAPTNDPG